METQTLAQWRKARGVSQAGLSTIISFDRSLISYVESGRVAASAKFLKECAEALGIQPGQIVVEPPPRIVRLPQSRSWLPAVLTPDRSRVAPALRQVFALAISTKRGKAIVDAVDSQRLSGPTYCAIKTMGGYMNGPEQKFLLLSLLDQGALRELRPDEVRISLAVVYPPQHWWLVLVRNGCIYFPQLTVSVNGYYPRLDYLIVVPTSPPLLINQELDGPLHKGREQKDRERARALGLVTLRIPVDRLEEENFLEWYDRALADLIRRERVSWRPRGSW